MAAVAATKWSARALITLLVIFCSRKQQIGVLLLLRLPSSWQMWGTPRHNRFAAGTQCGGGEQAIVQAGGRGEVDDRVAMVKFFLLISDLL
ncbi:hypothetical protein PI125_g23336 [Phytophthora idaei]|nr:hypothetical protein PI125_g23336 [Phytophthora idaei]